MTWKNTWNLSNPSKAEIGLMKTTLANADAAWAQLLPAEVQPGTSPCPRPIDPPWAEGSDQAAPGIPWGKRALRGCHAKLMGSPEIYMAKKREPPCLEQWIIPIPALLFPASLSCWFAEFCAKWNKSPRVTRGCRQAPGWILGSLTSGKAGVWQEQG